MDTNFYHEGSRRLQDSFDSRRLADRLAAVTLHREFTDDDRAFIEEASFFLLATADATGRPECSFKGGVPGFVRVTGPGELSFPDYDGNGMFRSLGNINVNPVVGLLFIRIGEKPKRLRINGRAQLVRDDEKLRAFAGAQLLVHVRAHAIFPNCPRYIPDADGNSPFAPRCGVKPLEPEWKSFDAFKDAIPPRAPTPGN